jgi:two-component system chemotaxis response regulator CheB
VKNARIRVLVIDDSLLFREIIARGLETDPQIEVVGKAADAFEAKDMILATKPNVVTCDIEMPKMNGIEFIRRLMPMYPVPVIAVSGLSNTVFDALSAGAVDFVLKPDERSPQSVSTVIGEVIEKVKIASQAQVAPACVGTQACGAGGPCPSDRIIGIGASTGGTEAIYRILQELSPSVPGIVIVQHIPTVFSGLFAQRLNNQTHFRVKEAEDGDAVEPGSVLIAPGNRHMRVWKSGRKYKVELFDGPKQNGHCPSVDVLFQSMARHCGKNAIGVILTGMGRDGASGLLSMRSKGAITLGQDESTSVVYGMPKIAWEIGAVQRQVPLPQMAKTIADCLRKI